MQINLESYSSCIKLSSSGMHKGTRTPAHVVQHEMGLAPFEKSVFVFCGKIKRLLKAIVWDSNE